MRVFTAGGADSAATGMSIVGGIPRGAAIPVTSSPFAARVRALGSTGGADAQGGLVISPPLAASTPGIFFMSTKYRGGVEISLRNRQRPIGCLCSVDP